jgi:GMP synthase-like glutamine amidotransferase
MTNKTRRFRKKGLRLTKRLADPAVSVGIVSMMKDGSVSIPVRRAFRTLHTPITIYKYNTPDLYNKILSGNETHWFFTGNGPDFVTDDNAPSIDKRIYSIKNKMILFICYSHQLAALNAGATIYTMDAPIHRNITLERLIEDPIFNGLPKSTEFFAYYTQYVVSVPKWKLLAMHGKHIGAMKHGKNIYSIQVHPERLAETYIVLENWLSMQA